MSFLQLLLNPGKRTLAEVVLKLPNQGVGSRVTRRTWAPFGNSYWEVTRVVPKGEAGKDTEVWGVLTWRGQPAEQPSKVNGADKPLWRWMPNEEQLQRLEPLARQLQREQGLAAKAAAAAAQDAGSSSSTAAADS